MAITKIKPTQKRYYKYKSFGKIFEYTDVCLNCVHYISHYCKCGLHDESVSTNWKCSDYLQK